MKHSIMEYSLISRKEQNSKIYTIRSNQTEKYYVGSTYQPLSKRFADHKNYLRSYWKTNKYLASFEVIQYDDAYIEIYEDCKGLNRYELFRKENEIIRKLKNEVVNIVGGGKRQSITDDKKQEMITISKQKSDEHDKNKLVKQQLKNTLSELEIINEKYI